MAIRQFEENPSLRFCKVKKGTKKPFEKDWVNKPYTYSEILPHIQLETNYGVLCGYGSLIVIDSDENELREAVKKNLPQTFRIKTGGGGTHDYYFCNEVKKKIILEREKHFGEVQSFGTQVVGPKSIHPNGKTYEIEQNLPIATINYEQLMICIKPFMKEIQILENRTINENKNYGDSDINTLNISEIIKGDFKLGGRGEYYGSNPWHGSNTGMNFWINPNKNVAYCFRCNAGISVSKAIALNEKVISSCSDRLTKGQFIDVLRIAQEKYGLKKIERRIKEEEENGSEKPKIILMSKFSPVPYAKKLLEITQFLYDSHKRFWRYYPEEGIWKEDAEFFIRNKLRVDLMGEDQQKKNYIEEVVSYIKDICWTEKNVTLPSENIIAFKNCLYNLEKDEISSFTPEIFIVNRIPIEIDSLNTDYDLIDQFFEDCLGDKKQILYDVMAYTLLRDYPYQKFFILHGKGGNGKTVFSNLLIRFLGLENISCETPQSLVTNRFARGNLWNKLANISSDIPYTYLENTNVIKELTGETYTNCERKYKEPFQFKSFAKIIWSANELPQINDKTRAFYRRVYIIKFERDFEGDKEDLQMTKKITIPSQLSGLAWRLIKTLKEIKERKYQFSWNPSIKEMEELYEDLSNPLSKFLREKTKAVYDGKIPKWEFRDRFLNWLRDNGFRIWGEREINAAMRDRFQETKMQMMFEEPSSYSGTSVVVSKWHRCWEGLGWIQKFV